MAKCKMRTWMRPPINDNEVVITRDEYLNLQRKLWDIRNLCSFKDIPMKEKIIGSPILFIDSILKRIAEIIDG